MDTRRSNPESHEEYQGHGEEEAGTRSVEFEIPENVFLKGGLAVFSVMDENLMPMMLIRAIGDVPRENLIGLLTMAVDRERATAVQSWFPQGNPPPEGGQEEEV